MLDAILIQISTSYIHHSIRSEEPQLGQYYIAEYAKHKGFNLGIKKYSSSEPIVNSLLQLIDEHKCLAIGFYVDSENSWTIRRILLNIKLQHPNLFVLIGGPQVTGDWQLALKRIPQANCAIIGEGEIPTVEILKQLKSGDVDLSKINGLGFLKDSEAIQTGPQPQMKNLDCYPFPHRYDYTLDKNIAFEQIVTGRGCIGRCAFCFEGSKKDNILRLRSVESVIEEIDYIAEHIKNEKYITFLDDTFIINPDRTEKICGHLIEKYKGELKWFCEGRVDILIKNLHLLPLMKEAGLVRIQLGGESGEQSILDAYNKGIKIDQLKTVVAEIYKAGIPSVYINYIVGGANETIESFGKSVELARCLIDLAPGCAEVGCSLFSPYVGTPMREHPEKYGIHIKDREVLRGPDGFVPTIETDSLTEEKILQLKSVFESQVKGKEKELCATLPRDVIYNHFYMYQKFGLDTDWLAYCKQIEPYKNYFESIIGYGFYAINDLSYDELMISVPFRTVQPVSDGEHYYRTKANGEMVINEGLISDVFMLSSGKICFHEIVYLLSKADRYKDVENLEHLIHEAFLELDKDYFVVWKKDF